MARTSTNFLVMTIVLSLLLTSITASRLRCRHVTQFCGGKAGFACCAGLTCKLEGTFPDAGGKCEKIKCPSVGEFCGGFAGIGCCKGLTCKLDDQGGIIADAGGVCVHTGY